MSETNAVPNLEVLIGKTTYEVTDMRGHTVGYLRKVFGDQGFPTSPEQPAQVFTGGPTESDPAAILKRQDGMQWGKNERGIRIVQGLIVTVSEDYVLSPDDLSVKLFAPGQDSE